MVVSFLGLKFDYYMYIRNQSQNDVGKCLCRLKNNDPSLR